MGIIDTYEYQDSSATTIFRVERYDPKEFKQSRPDGNGGWIPSMDGVKRVLYRLPRVLEAKKRGDRIYLVEGERDVHTLERFGRVATSVPGGASKWSAGYARTLRGAKVTIIGDADRAGLRHVLKVAQALEGVASELRVFLPDPLKGNDVTDLLEDCRSDEDAVKRLRACLVRYELRKQDNVVEFPARQKPHEPHVVLMDRETGEVVQPYECESCQMLQDQLDGAGREIRAWRSRYADLARTSQREAKSSPWWPVAARLFQEWKLATGHGRSEWTYDRFAVCEHLLAKYGPEAVERAIAGISYDPFVTTRRNGTKKRHDGWDLLFKNADKFEEYANKAPAGWESKLKLPAPASAKPVRRSARQAAVAS